VTIGLSNRLYSMLHALCQLSPGQYMSIDTAQQYDQRAFRSMLIRKYVAYSPGHGFRVTREGRAAWNDFHATDIARKNPQLPLTAYFDPTAYGLKLAKPRKTEAA